MSDEVLTWLEETNLTEKPQIIYDFVEAGMTSIYQPPDVVVNKPLKDVIKRAYGEYRNQIAGTFIPGAKIEMSREKLTNIISDAYAKINDDNMENMYIRRAFDLCVLNPYAGENSIKKNFIAHLDSLTTTSTAYYALIEHHTALDLDCH